MTQNANLRVNDPDVDDRLKQLITDQGATSDNDRWDPGATVGFPPLALDAPPAGLMASLRANIEDW